MEKARGVGDGDAYHLTNLTFHTRLMEYTGNQWLATLDERIKKQLLLFLRKGISAPTQLKMSNADHRAILDAIVSGDAEAAAAAYEAHSITGKQRMLHTVGRTGAVERSPQPTPRPRGRATLRGGRDEREGS